MKIQVWVLIISLLGYPVTMRSQDTFSIIAVDSITGEIGGAGASCIDDSQIPGGVLIINDIIPGRGGIHTQSYWNATNQQNAHDRMEEGMSPDEIIQWLVDNDVQNNPGIRQYGIADFNEDGSPRAAAFTGNNCLNYKNHIVGPNYAIQGNILLGQQILDSMESRFLNTEGELAVKLMAALQGANVPGADSRCTGEGVSSLSSFLRVAQPYDTNGTYYCNLVVPSTPYGVEPIDSLQALFDEWLLYLGDEEINTSEIQMEVTPNPASGMINIVVTGNTLPVELALLNQSGQLIRKVSLKDARDISFNTSKIPGGLYLIKLLLDNGNQITKKLIILH